MEELIKVLVDNGVTIVVIAYFMYRDNKFMNQINNLMGGIDTTLKKLEKIISK